MAPLFWTCKVEEVFRESYLICSYRTKKQITNYVEM